MSELKYVKVISIKPEIGHIQADLWHPPNTYYMPRIPDTFKTPLIKHHPIYPELFRNEIEEEKKQKQKQRSIEDPWEISQDVK